MENGNELPMHRDGIQQLGVSMAAATDALRRLGQASVTAAAAAAALSTALQAAQTHDDTRPLVELLTPSGTMVVEAETYAVRPVDRARMRTPEFVIARAAHAGIWPRALPLLRCYEKSTVLAHGQTAVTPVRPAPHADCLTNGPGACTQCQAFYAACRRLGLRP